MHILAELLQQIIYFVGTHPLVVRAFTAAGAGCCAAVLLILSNKAASAEKWAKYFGYAFLIYFIEYSLQFIVGFIEGFMLRHHLVPASPFAEMISYAVPFLATCGSAANNLFFLAAALELTDWRWLRVLPPWISAAVEPRWAWVPTLPRWAWVFAAFTLVGMVDESVCVWCRIPDAIFSSICLGTVGYAAFTNLSYRPRQRFSLLAIVVSGTYCIIQILFGLNPWFAREGIFSFVINWSNTNVSKIIVTPSPQETLRVLDAIDIAIVLPLKFGLFFLAVILLIRSIVIISSDKTSEMLKAIIQGRLEYISNAGIVKSIGEGLDADVFELSIRLPGRTKERIASFRWFSSPAPLPDNTKLNDQKNSPRVGDPEICSISEPRIYLARKLLTGGKEIVYPNSQIDSETTLNHYVQSEGHASLVGEPILFHGAIIGSLSARWKTDRIVNKTAIQHLRQWATLLSPAIQSYREIAAIDQLSYRLTRWLAEAPSVNIEPALGEVSEILDDILSPLAMGISLEFGFQSFKTILPKRNSEHTRLLEEISTPWVNLSRSRKLSKNGYDILISRLGVAKKPETNESNKSESYRDIGVILLVVPSARDVPSVPILGSNDFHRRTMSALMADVFLDITRENFGRILNTFSVELNRADEVTESNWFKTIQTAALDAGLMWVVTSEKEKASLSGEPEWVSLIENSPMPPPHERPQWIPLERPVKETQGIIQVSLPKTGRYIWFGVGRQGFGQEFEFPSPWRVFLEQFGETADAGIDRQTTAIAFQNFQMETTKAQEFMKVNTISVILLHELGKLVKGITAPLSTIIKAYKAKQLEVKEPIIGETIMSLDEHFVAVSNYLDDIDEIRGTTNVDNQRPCRLVDVVGKLKKLHSQMLKQSNTQLDIRVPEELVVDVSFDVAYLALSTLIENAEDVLKQRADGGIIRIEADYQGEGIECHVWDNGPGVPPPFIPRLFRVGGTTKQGSGGWGLYLIKNNLELNRSKVELTDPGPGGTRFTISFPKLR